MYPTYEKPTLKEALCEIKYKPVSQDVSKGMLTGLVSLLSEEYPFSDVIDESPFHLNVAGQGIISEKVHRYKFSSDMHSYLVAVKKDSFSFVLNPSDKTKYDQTEFYKKLCSEWNKISKLLQVEKIDRIGVRFVNLLEVDVDKKNDEYFQAESDYLTKFGLDNTRHFFNRAEVSLDEQNRSIVMVGCQPSKQHVDKKELLLDIDRIVEQNDMRQDSIESKVKTLHKDIEEVFFNSITEDYKREMGSLIK